MVVLIGGVLVLLAPPFYAHDDKTKRPVNQN